MSLLLTGREASRRKDAKMHLTHAKSARLAIDVHRLGSLKRKSPECHSFSGFGDDAAYATE